MPRPASTSWRQQVFDLVTKPWFSNFILGVILFNAVILGLQTAPQTTAGWTGLLMVLDKICLSIFVVELLLRLYAWRLRFFKDPWSLFDLTVVAIALVPATGPLAILRAFRILRVLRVMTIVPSMRRVVSALLGALPGLGAIALLLLLIYYVFAVIATDLFGQHFPDWFGTIGLSLYTLFQVMTLESWSMGISRPVMEQFPYAWLFFVPFILVATFTILNLFIAIIVNAMQTFTEQDHAHEVQERQTQEAQKDQAKQDQRVAIHEELRALRAQLLRQ
jgi:voltage-gated sodium channel